uniref:Pecanex-like protein n=1 Tax=Ascaris lumbricoides TaxID=6252 RepID=A0A0M3I4A2_ASCLU
MFTVKDRAVEDMIFDLITRTWDEILEHLPAITREKYVWRSWIYRGVKKVVLFAAHQDSRLFGKDEEEEYIRRKINKRSELVLVNLRLSAAKVFLYLTFPHMRETHDKLKYRAKLGACSSSRRSRVESEESSHDGDDDSIRRTSHDESHLDGSRSELKQLQDSLTRFFTPRNRRRSRVAQSSFSLEQLEDRSTSADNDDRVNGSLKNESDEEKVSDHADAVSKYKLRHDDDWQLNGIEGKRIFKAEHLRPLCVSVDGGARSEGPSTGPKATHSAYQSWKTNQPGHSPHRRNDVLYDALSPYFSASSEKRRTFSKGEYAQLSGVRRRGRSGDSSSTQEQVSPSSAWSMERARTSPEHSSCESLAQGEPGRHDEELAVDESRVSSISRRLEIGKIRPIPYYAHHIVLFSSVERHNNRRRKFPALQSTSSRGRPCAADVVNGPLKSNSRPQHRSVNASISITSCTYANSSPRTSSSITRTRSVYLFVVMDKLWCEQITSSKRGRSRSVRRERTASAKRVRTPRVPHTPTTSPETFSAGSHSSCTLRTSKEGRLKRTASSSASRKRVSAASLVRKARSRTMRIRRTSARTPLVKNTSQSRVKPVRGVPGAGRALRLAMAGSSAETELVSPFVIRPHIILVVKIRVHIYASRFSLTFATVFQTSAEKYQRSIGGFNSDASRVLS